LPSQSDISRLYNSNSNTNDDDVVPTGSVKQVYEHNSQSKFTLQTTVTNWIPVSHTESYYGNGNHGFSKFKEAIIEALQQLDAESDDSDFDYNNFDLNDDNTLDGLGLLHSGYGAEFGGDDCYGTINTDRIWSHKGGLSWTSSSSGRSIDAPPVKVNRYYVSSSLRGKCSNKIVRMGVICHEIGHYIGLPDLYDSTFHGVGLGGFDFMSQSWGMDGSGKYPPNLSAWSKVKVGWVTPLTIEHDGTYEVKASSSDSHTVYKIQHGYPNGEYLLIENRQPSVGYDSKLPMGGIAIYHVDENVANTGQDVRGYPSDDDDDDDASWPSNGKHYMVSLLSPDGNYDLEKGINQGDSTDLWSSSSSSSSSSSILTELKAGGVVHPNTDTYQNGIIKETGIRLFDFSVSDIVMTFKVEGLPPPPPPPSLTTTTTGTDGTTTTTTDTSSTTTTNNNNLASPKVASDEKTSSPPPSSSPPTTLGPTTSMPTTSTPTTKQPTSQPVTSSAAPTHFICTNLCLVPISSNECPDVPGLLPNCMSTTTNNDNDSSVTSVTTVVAIGELCDADGECNTDQLLDNCMFYDIYKRVDCSSNNNAAADMTNWLTPFEGNDIILPDNVSSPTSSPTTTTTSKPSVQKSSSSVAPTTTRPSSDSLLSSSLSSSSSIKNDDDDECPYYPGWNQGLSYCLKDCLQPSYMVSKSLFEFDTIEECCDLHYQGSTSCETQTLLLAASDNNNDDSVNGGAAASNSSSSSNNVLGKIRGQIWRDGNANDWKDEDERHIADGVYNVAMDLYDCSASGSAYNSQWIKSVRTSLDGSYQFDTLYTPSSYYVQVTVPEGYHLSKEQTWLEDTEFDSDFDNVSGRSACIEFGIEKSMDVVLDGGMIPNDNDANDISSSSSSGMTTMEAQLVSQAAVEAGEGEQSGVTQSSSSSLSYSSSGMQHTKSASKTSSGSDETYVDQPQETQANTKTNTNTPALPSSTTSLRGSLSSAAVTVFVSATDDVTIHSHQDMNSIGEEEEELLVGPHENILLKFNLNDLSEHDYQAAHKAVLRLYSLTSSPIGGVVHLASSNDWDESTATWSSAPDASHILGKIGKTHAKSWIEVDVSGLLLQTEDGYATLRIKSDTSNHSFVAKYSSKENKSRREPELKLLFEAASAAGNHALEG